MKKKAPERSIPAGTQYFSSHDQMPNELIQKLEQMAFEFGRYFDSYIITEPNRHYFWSQKESGVVGFEITGRYINVASGLITHPDNRTDLIKDFISFAELNGLVISFYSIDQEDADLLQASGFQVTKFGEETSIPLSNWSWSGKKFEWVRRQANFVKRKNIVFEEVSEETASQEEWSQFINELIQISDEHLSTKAQKGSIPLFEGLLLPGYIYRRRIFIARNLNEDSEKRIEGFILCNPFQNGEQWGIEMYRKRIDAVRGTVPFLVYHSVNTLQNEGRQTVSLSPIPALRCEKPLKNDSRIFRTFLSIWYNHSNYMFDLPGIYHFKSRFRPEFSNIYSCTYPKTTIFSILGYARCCKMADVKNHFFIKVFFHRLFRRKTLAQANPKTNPATN
jgi:phosphatidylglycerol lysyltransferase